jgi:hypothetical protein
MGVTQAVSTGRLRGKAACSLPALGTWHGAQTRIRRTRADMVLGWRNEAPRSAPPPTFSYENRVFSSRRGSRFRPLGQGIIVKVSAPPADGCGHSEEHAFLPTLHPPESVWRAQTSGRRNPRREGRISYAPGAFTRPFPYEFTDDIPLRRKLLARLHRRRSRASRITALGFPISSSTAELLRARAPSRGACHALHRRPSSPREP